MDMTRHLHRGSAPAHSRPHLLEYGLDYELLISDIVRHKGS
jgi:hypothetical protein